MAEQTKLEQYREMINRQPICEDPWFSARLLKYRSGDEGSFGRLSGVVYGSRANLQRQRRDTLIPIHCFAV